MIKWFFINIIKFYKCPRVTQFVVTLGNFQKKNIIKPLYNYVYIFVILQCVLGQFLRIVCTILDLG